MAVLLTAPPATGDYTLLLADGADPASADLVTAAQRLRHRVFAAECGATLRTPVSGLDVDDLDEHCDHLVVREGTSGEVVGTYRLLTPARAARAGRRYADGEFDLAALEPLRDRLVETGRSCVHPDHRSGAVINLIWAGIARYLHLAGHNWLGGCASVPLDAIGPVWEYVRTRHLSPPALRVRPRRPVPAGPVSAGPVVPVGPVSAGPVVPPVGPVSAGPVVPRSGRPALPPLLRGYLRLGAWVCGEPAYDPDFGVADLYLLLSMDRIDPRYRRHFLGATR